MPQRRRKKEISIDNALCYMFVRRLCKEQMHVRDERSAEGFFNYNVYSIADQMVLLNTEVAICGSAQSFHCAEKNGALLHRRKC